VVTFLFTDIEGSTRRWEADAEAMRCAFNQSRGGRAEHHPTRRSDRLHPLGHPDLLTDCRVTQSTRTYFTGYHLTGVQPHTQLEFHTVAVSDFDSKPRRLLLKAEGSHACTCRVVLESHWRAEHRHDPVAGELVHGPAVALHHRTRMLDQLGHDLPQPLGAHRRRDLHRMHNVGEQDRHLLELRRFADRCDLRTAVVTELGVLAQFSAACHARHSGRRHASTADPGVTAPPIRQEYGVQPAQKDDIDAALIACRIGHAPMSSGSLDGCK
jgi:hypothetical protein